MFKVLLLIDCDGCRRLFEFSRTASEDTSAWRVHGEALLSMAKRKDWAETIDGNSHYCPQCWRELEDLLEGCLR